MPSLLSLWQQFHSLPFKRDFCAANSYTYDSKTVKAEAYIPFKKRPKQDF
jgi:hypothetical protein